MHSFMFEATRHAGNCALESLGCKSLFPNIPIVEILIGMHTKLGCKALCG